MSTAISVATSERNQYVPRGRNELHTIFERHFDDFCDRYDEKYAATYGRYRLERVQQLGERFCTCGDYLHGVARIRCTNPECGHDYFRPFSCKGLYLCLRMQGRATNEVSDQASCSRKRTILFAEHLTNDVLLKLPHRQFVFTKVAFASRKPKVSDQRCRRRYSHTFATIVDSLLKSLD